MRTSNEIPRLMSAADPAELPLKSGEYGIPYIISNVFGVFQMRWRSVFQIYVKCVCSKVVLLVLGIATVRELSTETVLFKSFE